MHKMMGSVAAVILMIGAAGCATTMSGPAVGGWSHGDIAAIVTAANNGEIEQGQVASSRASSADVRAFAQMMVADHTAAISRGQEVFASRGITPTDNAVASDLRSNSAQTVSSLSSYSGDAFDAQYMQTQVALHQWLLTTLDANLIPSARDPRVRELLTTQRASVAAHLDRARSIAAGLR